jgi:hypothetical protein
MERSLEEYYVGAGMGVVSEELDEIGGLRYFVTDNPVERFGP